MSSVWFVSSQALNYHLDTRRESRTSSPGYVNQVGGSQGVPRPMGFLCWPPNVVEFRPCIFFNLLYVNCRLLDNPKTVAVRRQTRGFSSTRAFLVRRQTRGFSSTRAILDAHRSLISNSPALATQNCSKSVATPDLIPHRPPGACLIIVVPNLVLL